MLEDIIVEHDKGRRLFIGTTNLDAKRPVIWNIGIIAKSGAPNALELIRNIMLASASIARCIHTRVHRGGSRRTSLRRNPRRRGNVVSGVSLPRFTGYAMGKETTRIKRKISDICPSELANRTGLGNR